ncbi:MAG: ABC transporter permease [Opitutales bacterium]
MPSSKKTKAQKRSWFAIRKDLDAKQRTILTFLSFLTPLFIWSLVSYSPFIWRPDIKLQISAEREGITTVFTPGDHLSKEFFPTFVEGVQSDNAAIMAERESGDIKGTGSRIRRANLKKMRHIAAVATANGWLTKDQAEEDAELYKIWGGVAQGTLVQDKVKLNEENIGIIQRNWALMVERSEVYESKLLPEVPLEKLIPQGKAANPVFLPAPHEVLLKGIEDFTFSTEGDKPAMFERYKHSLTIVFSGFLLAALIGTPLGIMCGTFDFFSKLFEPFIDFFRYMPAPAFSTLLVAILSLGDAPKVGLVFLGTFFQLVLVVANTTRQLDASLIEAAQTLGAKGFTLIRRVILPGITPNLYNDMRILLGWAWTWLVIAELIGTKSGLTEFIDVQGRFRNFDSVYPIIILIGMSGFATDQFLSSLRKYLFPWTPEASEKKHGPFGKFFLWVIDRNAYVDQKG